MSSYRIIIAQTAARTHTGRFFVDADSVGAAMRQGRQKAADEWGLTDPAAIASMEIVQVTEL